MKLSLKSTFVFIIVNKRNTYTFNDIIKIANEPRNRFKQIIKKSKRMQSIIDIVNNRRV